MKNKFFFRTLLLFATVLMFTLSCSKKDENINPKKEDVFPDQIKNFLTQGMLDSLRGAGATIYSGNTPPIVNGIYLLSPDSCIYDNTSALTGSIITDQRYRFSNQNNTNFTLTVDVKDLSTNALHQTAVKTFICGSGNNFSIFILRTILNTIPAEAYNVYSGTLTTGGVLHLQNCLYIRNKGDDPTHLVAKAGTIRLFINAGNGLAINIPVF